MTHQVIISITAASRRKKRQIKKNPNVSLEVSKKNRLKFTNKKFKVEVDG